MNILAFVKRRLASASLFARLLLVMFATVMIAQAITFALVVTMPTPSQPVTAISTIAQALRTGTDGTAKLRVTTGAEPNDNLVDQREYIATAQLAAALGVSDAQVRVVQMRKAGGGAVPPAPRRNQPRAGLLPLPLDQSAGAGSAENPGAAADAEATKALAEQGEITGPFEAGLILSDGRWRVVTFEGARIARWQWEVLLWLLGSIAAVAPLAWLFARRIADPIAAFAQAALRIGANPSVAPLEVTGAPEIAEAIAAINEMQHRILRFVEDRTMMIGAMAHDLRTPLMRLALRMEKAPADLRDAGQRDIEEIQEMTNAALAFVRDLGTPEMRHRIALRPLLETIADDFADRGADVALATEAEAIVSGDLGGIRRMVNNLVVNAVLYGGGARIELSSNAQEATIAVADDGPGIPPADMDRVFDPFFRVEKSRNRNTGGTGLGLASARAIARAHGGDITLSNRPEGGVLALVTLPL